MAHKRTKENVHWEGVITNIHARILTKLARYRYLTLSQLLQIGVGTTQYKYLWKQAASLRDRKHPLVKCQRFSVSQTSKNQPPKRVEDWYYLNEAGKRALLDELNYDGQIKMPISRASLPYKDYQHRIRTINFQIKLDQWAEQNEVQVLFFDTYFDKEGNNRVDKNLRAKTRIALAQDDFFIPDGAFKIIKEDQERFFLMETYNGKDTSRTIHQLHKHALALTKRYTHQAYNLPSNKSYNIVLIFEYESHLKAVIERIQTKEPSFQIIQKYFRAKSLEQLENTNFFEHWSTLGGEEVSLV
ncbi:MAG: hypothetical protein AAFO82_12400 [Bacteroidota bacterium]